jgi:hypothetical protein
MADRPTKITFAEMRGSGVVHLDLGPGCEIYLALTTLAHHYVMKTRDNMSAVIEGLQRQHGLLAAYLEAIAETPKPVHVEKLTGCPPDLDCLKWCRRHRRSSFGVPIWCELTLKDAVWLQPRHHRQAREASGVASTGAPSESVGALIAGAS